MAQSLARVLIHLVFATKNREPLLADDFRPAAFEYLAGILSRAGCVPVAVGGMPDHAHLLFGLGRTVTLAQVAEVVKKRSSAWAKQYAGPSFAWQGGYAAFSVSESNAPRVRAYIAAQQDHRREMTFQDEFRELLRRHGLGWDERYVWD